MPKITLNIDRKTASKLLGVSVRTIDRHIRTGKLPAYRENGRIWLNKEEVKNFNKIGKIPERQSIDAGYPVYIHQQQNRKTQEGDFYKDLYEEAKNALSDYRQKLDQANYRIGQLESQMLHSTSLHKSIDRRDDYLNAESIKRDLIEREKELFILKDIVKRERLSRIVFAVLTYVLLAMLPLIWYLLR